MGDFAVAEPDFAEVLKADPSDAYSALWLYLVQARAGNDGLSELERDSKQINLTAWPGQTIELYLRTGTPVRVLSTAGDPYFNKSQHCEDYLFLAEKALFGVTEQRLGACSRGRSIPELSGKCNTPQLRLS
jgi:lipoprotein NlpI